MFNTGTKGPLRLFQEQLSGQASWMLPFAIIAAAAVLLGWRRRSMSQRHREALFWLFWLLPVAGFFSIAGFFHSYYLIMLAPPVAALVGAGWSEMWAKYRQGGGWQAYLLPAAIAVTSLFQWYILSAYESTVGLLLPLLIAGLGLITALVLVSLAAREQPVVRIAAAAGLGIMLIGPAYWSATPIVYGENSMIPAAGPDSSADGPRQRAGRGERHRSKCAGLDERRQFDEWRLLHERSGHARLPGRERRQVQRVQWVESLFRQFQSLLRRRTGLHDAGNARRHWRSSQRE